LIEPKNSSEVDKILTEYASAVNQVTGTTAGAGGGLMLAVVGGKLSEGINCEPQNVQLHLFFSHGRIPQRRTIDQPHHHHHGWFGCVFGLPQVSNNLCRAVVVVGIPYPNSQSVELKERIAYVQSLEGAPKDAGRTFCEQHFCAHSSAS
jgi:chromosome transmission fidelity protein 1